MSKETGERGLDTMRQRAETGTGESENNRTSLHHLMVFYKNMLPVYIFLLSEFLESENNLRLQLCFYSTNSVK